jgi:glycerophosphoryl diester phosphodiesterase
MWMKAALLLIVLAAVLPAQSDPKKITVQGHRGARWVLPENTLPAFNHAFEMGADVLELDLAVTKDDVLVVSHDLIIHKEVCTGPADLPRVIRELTLTQIKQFDCGANAHPSFPYQSAVPGTRMPTLDEVLVEMAPKGDFLFNIETKIDARRPELAPQPAEYVRLLVETVRKHDLVDRVLVQSFDFRTLKETEKQEPRLKRVALYGRGEESFVDVAKRAGTDIVSPNHRLVTPDKVAKAHAAGLTVVAWTANLPEEWQSLIDAKVDSIITDNPQGLVLYLQERNLH